MSQRRMRVLIGLAMAAMGGTDGGLARADKPLSSVDPLPRRLTADQKREVAASLVNRGDGYSLEWTAKEVDVLYVLPLQDLVREGGSLVVAGRFVSHGEPSELVCFLSRDCFFVVDRPEKLAGYVRIRSPADALRYARLFASPATVKCFEWPWWVEVVPAKVVSKRYLFGRRSPHPPRDVRRGGQLGLYGVLNKANWARSGLDRASVEQTPEGYVVTRALFRGRGDLFIGMESATVHIVRETISPNGEFRREVLREVEVPVGLYVPVKR